MLSIEMNKKKNIIMVTISLILGLLVFSRVQSWFKMRDVPTYQGIRGFYEEPKNSLDAIYVGASNVYYYWQAPVAWADYGITVWNYNSGAMPAEAVPFLMTEARKTQSNPLFIVNLNMFHEKLLDVSKIHRVTNYLNLSFNKINMINSLADDAGIKGLEKLEFFFPIIRFHNRWSELSSLDFTKSLNGMKIGLYNTFFTKTANMEKRYKVFYEEADLGDIQKKNLYSLLDYCDENDIRALFVIVPQVYSANDPLGKQLNTMKRIVEERQYDCIDLSRLLDEIGIQTDSDFRDRLHLNVHGAIKYTEYLAQYLKEHYGFEDKRNRSDYGSWNNASELYFTAVSPYTAPFERNHSLRDYNLQAPHIDELKINGQTITLSWQSSDQVAYYEIYRKSSVQEEKNWHLLETVSAERLTYIDSGLNPMTSYSYTVVPVSIRGNNKYYGNYNYSGVKGKTQ